MLGCAGGGGAAATAARGGVCSRRGLVQRGCTPHFLFGLGRKENGPCTVQKKRPLGRAPVQWPSARDGGRRIGACSDFAWPSGTLCSSARSVLPSRGGWCGGRRGARTHLTSFSFRAFRFATRCPGGRRGCCIALCRSLHQLPASGSEKRSWMYPELPRAEGFPKGRAFPSLTAARDSQPSPAGGRRSAPAQTDPPKRLFLFHRARRILFLGKTKKRMGGASRMDNAPCGSRSPVAAARRPPHPSQGHISRRHPAARLTGHLTPRPAHRAPG